MPDAYDVSRLHHTIGLGHGRPLDLALNLRLLMYGEWHEWRVTRLEFHPTCRPRGSANFMRFGPAVRQVNTRLSSTMLHLETTAAVDLAAFGAVTLDTLQVQMSL